MRFLRAEARVLALGAPQMPFLKFTEECHAAAAGKVEPMVVLENGKRARRMRVQVFENKFIERWFAQAHPITPGIWFGGLVVYGLYAGWLDHGLLAIPLFLSGVLITTLIEYCLHRFIFHKGYDAKDPEEQMQHFLLHGYHHEYPNDRMRLVLPPIGIWPVAVVVCVVWWLVFGAYWWPILGGTAAGYIAYDWLHYYTHHGNPKAGPGRWIKRYHMLHHHDSPHHRYGITSPLWDFVFRTYLPVGTLARQAGRHAAQAEDAA